MNCPGCGSHNVLPVSEVRSHTNYRGYGCCKGAVGAILFGPIGWLCGLCGMGKGSSTTVTTILWVCSDCGRKFG